MNGGATPGMDIITAADPTCGERSARSRRIGEIVVLTCARPRALASVLDRYAAMIGSAAEPPRLTVFDDSARAEDLAENARVIRCVEQRRGVTVWYAGPHERQRFVERLAATSGCTPETLTFGLLGRSWGERTAGCNRNAALLESAGRMLLSVDDDTDPALRPAPAFEPGLRFATLDGRTTDPVFPCDLWSSPATAVSDETALLAHGVLEHHERLLGLAAETCVAEFTAAHEPVRLDAACPDETASRLRGRRVVVTLPGLMGDCGWRTPAPYLWLRGRSFAELTRSAEHYRAVCASRTVLRVADSFTLVDRSMNMMGTFFGLDNTTVVPPFPPIGRGQDVVFGMLVGACVPDACFGHLPWAMLHEPVEQRRFHAREVVSAAFGADLCVVTAAVVRALSADLPAGDSETNLRQLGRRLTALGGEPRAGANGFIRSAVLRLVGEQFSALEAQLACGDAAPFWAADARKSLLLWRQASEQDAYHLPVECLKHADVSTAAARTVGYLEDFGRLLEEWPRIVRASVALRERGCGLASPARSAAGMKGM